MPQNLTPEQLAAILAGYPTMGAADQARQGLFAGWGENLPELYQSENWIQDGTGDSSSQHLGQPNRGIYHELSGSASDVWDPNTGQYLGQSTGMSDGKMGMLAALMLAGGAYGAYASGAGAGAGATTVGTTAGTTAGTTTGTELGTTGLNSMRAAELAGYSTNGAMPSSAAVAAGTTTAGSSGVADWLAKAASDPSNWARLAGAAAGAASSGDQTQSSTQNREPWGPAQDWIRQNIGIGQGLQQQYQQQPFSATQQQAYGNQFGLLNSANQSMPAWMQGMQANASGANNYDRNNPRRGLLGGGQATLPQLGLLNPDFTRFGG